MVGLLLLGVGGLWWRLSSGPIQLDVFTPWLVSAIEENFGSHERVEVGGTQIERTEHGAAVRVRDIVVRDPDGTVVASAPKAEIDVSGLSLFSGHMRAESLNLVGATMAVRIEPDGRVTVFASDTDKHPIATANVPAAADLAMRPAIKQDRIEGNAGPPADSAPRAPLVTAPAVRSALPRPPTDSIAALLSWLDGIGQSGLDGHDLRELGLKDGTLTVDDERTGKRWTFEDISLSIQRPHSGGIVVTVGSANPARPWGITASIKPMDDGYRSIALEARQVSADDLLLASRLGDGTLQFNVPMSASLRGVIGPNGVPQTLTGRVAADAGYFNDGESADGRIDLDHAEFKINWDAGSRVLTVPFQILSGGNRITLLGQVEAPAQTPGPWQFRIGGGTVVLNSSTGQGDALVLNNIAVSGQFDPVKKRFVVYQSEIGNGDVGVAMSGNADYSSGELRLAAGLAATRMSADALKRLWPVFVVPKVRDWFDDHLISGDVERVVIGVNSPLENLKASGPAGPGRRFDPRCGGDELRDPAGGRPAGVARRRSHRSHRRTRCADRAQQGGGRPAVRPQAGSFGRTVRSARYRAAFAAGECTFQTRRPGCGRRRASRHGPPARGRAGAVRSGDHTRPDERAGRFGDAAQARSAAGIDQLRHHRRRHELFRRTHDHGAEGRGPRPESQRQQSGLCAQRQRQDRRLAGQSRIPAIAR